MINVVWNAALRLSFSFSFLSSSQAAALVAFFTPLNFSWNSSLKSFRDDHACPTLRLFLPVYSQSYISVSCVIHFLSRLLSTDRNHKTPHTVFPSWLSSTLAWFLIYMLHFLFLSTILSIDLCIVLNSFC